LEPRGYLDIRLAGRKGLPDGEKFKDKSLQLYIGTSKQFVGDVLQNRVAEKLRYSYFEHFRHNPPTSEVHSWQNSLARMSLVLQSAGLDDNGIILEYLLPLSSRRLDVMLTGKNDSGNPNAVVVELKQWGETHPSNIDDCVATFVGGRLRDVLHPSKQVGQYAEYLSDCHTAFDADRVALAACSYLHNIQQADAGQLFGDQFREQLERYPLFTGDQAEGLQQFLTDRVAEGDGQEVLSTVLESKYRASKKLLEHTAAMIKGLKEYVLLDEQLVVFNAVLAQARQGFGDKRKAVVLVKGGPGTGKSVIALNLVGELSRQGYKTQHATGSKAFTSTVKKTVGSRAGVQFRYFNSYSEAESNIMDVLVMDEAHRIRAKSANKFIPAAKRSPRAQIDELLQAAKVSVFFIDDLQVVRPGEVGSSNIIRQAADRNGATLHEFELEAQFRCNGSEAFINWVDNTLGIRRTPNVMWDSKDQFEFRIVDSVTEIDAMIGARHRSGASARLVAGFCWKWSNPTADGQLVDDVHIGTWSRPWNAKPDAGRLAAGIPKSLFWASDPSGINQVGCIYTAQGFEFDYCGVIFGKDLRYDPTSGRWIGDRAISEDAVVKRSGSQFTDLVKQTYRVLLTRGMKGCYVYFQDEATRNFFRSRVE